MRAISQRENFVLLCLAVLLTAGFVVYYVGQERTFYYYDSAGYQALSVDLATQLRDDPVQAWGLFRAAIDQEYNLFFAIPLLPFILLFGESRLVFVLASALVYQLSYALIIGALAAHLAPAHRRLAFWAGVFLTLANPTAWGPLLRGWPDISAACMLALAAWCYLRDRGLQRASSILAIGILSVAAMLLRRHFTYSVIAFYLAIFLDIAIDLASSVNRKNWKPLAGKLFRLGLCAATTLAVTLLVARPFIERLVTTDYAALYASYDLPPAALTLRFIDQFGWVFLILAVLGWCWGAWSHEVDSDAFRFLSLVGGIAFVLWVGLARQAGVQYPLHFSFYVLLGSVVLLVQIVRQRALALRIGLLIICGSYWVGNTWAGLFVSLPVSAQMFFSAHYLPLIREDYDTVVQLVDTLREDFPADTVFYVVDSSSTMNADLLHKAEQQLYGRSGAHLRILQSPVIDSRDSYPLEALLQAQVVLLSTPPQYHLAPGEHDVIRVVAEAFAQNQEIAKDFIRMPEEFHLQKGATLNLYRRVQNTSLETALRTYTYQRAEIQPRPGSQLDWISLSPQQRMIQAERNGRFNYYVERPAAAGELAGVFLYTNDPPIEGWLVGQVEYSKQNCGEIQIGALTASADGTVLNQAFQAVRLQKGSFKLPFSGKDASFLLLVVQVEKTSSPEAPCFAEINWKLSVP